MANESASQLITALDILLEAERTALLDGTLDRMPPLLDEKARLIDALNALELDDGDMLDDLKTKIVRNQTLLDGALQGIRQVAGRLAALRRLRHSFDTYDESGHRKTIDGDVVHRVEKRA